MGTLRIIGGSLRGRRIRVPAGDPVRPTRDRVRQALFDILGQRTDGLAVLDLYAGSGALGLEALSRGARGAVFVESDSRVAAVLRENIRRLHVESETRVVLGDALDALSSGRLGPFDLVFADPPYGDPAPRVLLGALEAAGTVRRGGRAVLEQDLRAPPPDLPGAWRLTREARYGRTIIRVYVRTPRGVEPGGESRG